MSSHKCMVNSCCCGCSLRTGSLVIGILSLISDAYSSVETGMQASASGWWLLWVSEVFTVIHLVASIILLIGISKELAKFIKAFVYVNVAILFYDVVLVIVLLSIMGTYSDGDADAKTVLLSLALTYLFSFLLMIYYTVVIRSYAITVEERYKAPGTDMA